MGYTIDKLNEAEFFLNKLIEYKNVVPEFDYFLNAFVSSARSVLSIMKHEYHSNREWKNWYENKSTLGFQFCLVVLLKNHTLYPYHVYQQTFLFLQKYQLFHYLYSLHGGIKK